MVEYCYDCGNKIRRGHNSKWNLRPHEAKHLDDVCECDVPLSQYAPYSMQLLARLAAKGRRI